MRLIDADELADKIEERNNNDDELKAITEFLNDIEEVAQKHGLNIGAYENNMDENEIFDIMFIPALGYDAQFLQFGKKVRTKNKKGRSN